MIAHLDVVGVPVPQGSTRAFAGKGKAAGKVFTTNDASGTLAKWRGDIRTVALANFSQPTDKPVEIEAIFVFERPKSHLTSKGALRAGAPEVPGPDIDKLARGLLDALTGIAYRDDKQVRLLVAAKRYSKPGATLRSGVQIMVDDEKEEIE